MIVPMKKVMLAMLASERDRGLEALGRLGLLHPEPVNGSGEHLEAMRGSKALLEEAVNALSSRKPGESKAATGDLDALGLAKKLGELGEREKALQERRVALLRERDRVSELGDFDPESIRSLGIAGRTVRLHVLRSGKKPPSFPEGVDAIALGGERGKGYYLSLAPSDMDESVLPEAFVLPEARLSHMEAELSAIGAELQAMETQRDGLAAKLPLIKEELERLGLAEKLENLRSGIPMEGPVAYLTGWIPAPAVQGLADEASRRGWAFMDEEPSPEEMPPTQVRNHPLVRIVQPVFEFLGTVPSYREYEISAWFLLFFAVFFAMIFGDGGYGVLMLLGAGGLVLSSLFKRKKVPDGIWLLLLLSTCTVVWGSLTGSWFALPGTALPAWLRSLAIPAITGWNPADPSVANEAAGDNVKILCFMLGLVQLSLAHLKNVLRDIKAGSMKFLGQLGSLALVAGMFWFVLNLVIDPERFPIPNFSLYLVGVGFFLVLVFSNYEKNVLQSFLDGLKGIIPTFLGTVSVFADIVSYIRLWAVGLAGVAISQTVNGMASGLFKGFSGWAIAGVLLLAFGHGLNLVMSVLSVIVHGVRLNMLEFSGHLGMEWSGYTYEPFRLPKGGGASGKELT